MYPNVRAEMRRRGITLLVMAKALGISIGTLSQKLNGRYPITLNEAKKIKAILEVSTPMEELFEEAV